MWSKQILFLKSEYILQRFSRVFRGGWSAALWLRPSRQPACRAGGIWKSAACFADAHPTCCTSSSIRRISPTPPHASHIIGNSPHASYFADGTPTTLAVDSGGRPLTDRTTTWFPKWRLLSAPSNLRSDSKAPTRAKHKPQYRLI